MERPAHLGEDEGALTPLVGTRARVRPDGLRRVLVRLPNWLGDVCLAAPTIAALDRALPPGAEIVAAARPGVASIARRLPRVTETIVLSDERSTRALPRLVAAYRAARADAALVFPRSFRAALPAFLARVPLRVGLPGDGRRGLLTHVARPPGPLRGVHRSATYAAILSPLGLASEVDPWRLEPEPEAFAWVDAWRGAGNGTPDRPLVTIEPGGAYGTAKRWPEAAYAELCRRLVLEDGAEVVLVGTSDAAALHARIAAAAGAPLRSAAGATDLPRLAALLARARLLVTNDTGPMHLAAAVGTPILALFGSTDPDVCGPRGTGPITVLRDRVPCSPCWLRVCPIEGHPCLDPMRVERVLDAARRLLARA
ncbi:MAG TPA: lipopolysaccharide heptosyltransferase II [Planctomycetota bacterium]|nr:lipopolysaccharide heptosyltransferase II [Planctomycetota bacterium]